jgi:hypothetical protein
MEHLTDEQLQNTLNKLREELTRKWVTRKQLLKFIDLFI